MDNLYLYSTNAWFVFHICNECLDSKFHVYAANQFDAKNHEDSSNPRQIYSLYQEFASGRGLGHPKFQDVMEKMREVATDNRAKIGEDKFADIETLITLLPQSPYYFSPLLYIISYDKVAYRTQSISMSMNGKSWVEFIIEDLQRYEFEILTLDNIDHLDFPLG